MPAWYLFLGTGLAVPVLLPVTWIRVPHRLRPDMSTLKRCGLAAATILTAFLCHAGQITALAGPGPLVPTASMGTGRSYHTATLLADGSVLVAGGETCVLLADGGGCDMDGTATTATAEIYDPRTATWSQTGSMVVSREGATAIRLANGKVLVAGGNSLPYWSFTWLDVASAELYDPATGTWSLTGSLNSASDYGMLTLLANATVLAIGASTSAYLYHPDTGTWTATGSMANGHIGGTATQLANGQVLVAGGFTTTAYQSIASPEVYDPVSGTWSVVGAMVWPRASHSAALLSDGSVIVADGNGSVGGVATALTSAEIFQPSTGSWSATTSTTHTHTDQRSVLLIDGTFLLVDMGSEVYDPVARTWTLTSGATSNYGETATALKDGSVLVAGGCCDEVTWTYTLHAELYSAPSSTAPDPPLTATGRSLNATEGSQLNGVIATFTDADPNGTVSQYSAIISWGDGSSSPGTIAAGSTGFTVLASHTYLEEGSLPIIVSINDSSGAATSVTSSAAVGDAAVALTGTTATLNARVRISTTVTLGTISDSDPNGARNDYVVSIAWGDDTSSSATVTATGTGFSISATHTYLKRGKFAITLTGRDSGGAAATPVTESISVS